MFLSYVIHKRTDQDNPSLLFFCNQLNFLLVKLSTYGAHAFSCSGPAVWNSLPDYFRDHHYFLMSLACDIFRHSCLLVINIPATL